MDRRRFLKRSSIGFAGATLWSCGGSQVARVEEPAPAVTESLASILENSPFRFGFQSYSLRHFSETEELAGEAEQLGLAFVEVYNGHLPTDATDEEMSRFKQALEEVGVEVNAFGVEGFSADHEANQRLFQFGHKLGVENLSANPSKDAFESLDKLVAQYDIRIAIHNHGPEDERWRRPEWILEAVRDLDPRVGACVDTGHYLRAGVDPVEAIRMLGSRVLGVHLKDFDAESEEQIVGHGRLSLVDTFRALIDVGFKGPLSLEYESHMENPVPSMREGLAAAGEALARM
jgi:inosose dehydratase